MDFYFSKFKELRKKARFSVNDFCKEAGIARSTLWEWETNKRVPSEASIKMMAQIIGVSVSDISSLKDNVSKADNRFSESVDGWLSLGGRDIAFRQTKLDRIINEINSLNKEMNQAAVIINALLSTMRTMFYIKDAGLKYITANDIFLENISLNPSYKVAGKDDSAFFPIAEARKNTEEDNKVFETNQPLINVEGYIPGTRKKKWGLISKLPVRNSSGKIIGVVGTFVDITERKKAEEIRTLLEAALNNSQHVVWLQYVSPKYKLFYVSESVEPLYGYPAEKFLNDKDFWYNTCVFSEDRKLLDPDWIYGKTKDAGKRVFRIVRPDKEIRWIESFLVNCSTDNYIAFVERDVTEREEHTYSNLEMKIRKEIALKMKEYDIDTKIISKCTDYDK